jgi:hypothetical protein
MPDTGLRIKASDTSIFLIPRNNDEENPCSASQIILPVPNNTLRKGDTG